MQYENFEKVKEIVTEIDKYNKIIIDLSGDKVEMRINEGQFTIMTICTWDDCEHTYQRMAKDFVTAIVSSYKQHVKRLHNRLSEL